MAHPSLELEVQPSCTTWCCLPPVNRSCRNRKTVSPQVTQTRE